MLGRSRACKSEGSGSRCRTACRFRQRVGAACRASEGTSEPRAWADLAGQSGNIDPLEAWWTFSSGPVEHYVRCRRKCRSMARSGAPQRGSSRSHEVPNSTHSAASSLVSSTPRTNPGGHSWASDCGHRTGSRLSPSIRRSDYRSLPLSAARDGAKSDARNDNLLEAWVLVWQHRQVPGYASAEELWNSTLGRAVRAAAMPEPEEHLGGSDGQLLACWRRQALT